MQDTQVQAQDESRQITSVEIVGFAAACGLALNMGFGMPAAWCVFIAAVVGIVIYGWTILLPAFAYRAALKSGNLVFHIDPHTRRRIFRMCAATRGKRLVRRHIQKNGLSEADRGLDEVL